MTNKEKMEKGLIYDPMDKELFDEQMLNLQYLTEFNSTTSLELDKRTELCRKMFAEFGENCYIEPPFHANWAGKHVHFGNFVYANFNLTLVDDGHIYVGDNVMFGPNVTVITAGHPILPELRKKGLQFNADVHIHDNVWIGAGVNILPGITIGKNSVIGAGSVVTKDIPPNVVAVGNPCKILRPINKHDEIYYFKNKKFIKDN